MGEQKSYKSLSKVKGRGRGGTSKFDDSPLDATNNKILNNFQIKCVTVTKLPRVNDGHGLNTYM